MLSAIDSEGKVLIADKYMDFKGTVYCPSCKSLVIFKKGSIMRPHFAHKDLSICSAFSENESISHINGKTLLLTYFKTWARKVKLEPYLKEINQRPDLIVENKEGVPIAIEFQCSPISLEKIAQRTEGYREIDLEVLWIFGPKFQNKQFLTAEVLYSMNKEKILFLDPGSAQLKIYSNISKSAYRHFTYTQTRINLSTNEQIVTTSEKPTVEKVNKLIKTEYQILRKSLFHKNQKYQAFFKLLYENGDSIHSLPKEIFSIGESDYFINALSIEWKYHLLTLIEKIPQGETFHIKEIVQLFLEVNYKVHLLNCSKVETKHLLLKIINTYFQVLAESGVVISCSNNKWQVSKSAERIDFTQYYFKNHVLK